MNEDISTLEDFNSETQANEDSTKAISTGLDLLNQILERQYCYNNIGVQIRFFIKQLKKCLEIDHLIEEKVEHTRTCIWDNAEKIWELFDAKPIQIAQNEQSIK